MTLAPGEFAFLDGTILPQGVSAFRELLRGSYPDGSNAPGIDEWTSSAYWDPIRLRTFFQGLRQSNRFISYHALYNRWEELPLDGVPNAPPLYDQFGHLYERTALDWQRGHFYRLNGDILHRYVIDDERWEVFTKPDIGTKTIEWHGGLDQLILVRENKLIGFRDGVFTNVGDTPVHGYHSSARYNPVSNNMLMIGGNQSPNTVALLTTDGVVVQKGDAPFSFGISQDDLTYDPLTGNYLVLHRDRVLWEYDAGRDEWRVAADWSEGGFPLDNYLRIVPITIDELGIIAWQTPNGLTLYRHQTVFGSGQPVQEPEPVPESDPEPDLEPTPDTTTSTSPDPVFHPDGTLLMDQAATMQPGEWRKLADLTEWPGKAGGKSFKGFQIVYPIDPEGTTQADGMGWTQNLVYHEGRLLLLLMRSDHLMRAIIGMEPNGQWWRIDLPEGFDKGGRRPFNRLTQDDTYLYFAPKDARTEMGYFIRTPLDNPGVFERYGVPIGDDQMDSTGNFSVTYVPDWGRFYAYTPGGKLWTWTHGESAWTRLGTTPVGEDGLRATGYAGLVMWNDIRKELILVGGQTFGDAPASGHHVARLTEPMGEIQELPNMLKPDGSPLVYTAAENKLIVNPTDGSYIHIDRQKIIYRNSTVGGTYEVYDTIGKEDGWPLGNYELYAPYHVIPHTDVIVFVSHIAGVVLHRLKPISTP